MFNISVIGTGYVGLVNGACLSDMGYNVTCIDVNEEKIKQLNALQIPIYEPGLEEIVARNFRDGRLRFSSDYESISDADYVFICVGTPQGEDGSADLKYVIKAAVNIAEHKGEKPLVIITKSTVPVGTSNKVANAVHMVIDNTDDVYFVSNPEFLKEGSAVRDCTYPDRIVVGTDNEHAKKAMEELYRPFMLNHRNIIFTDIESAEMIKYASNSMLATRISFMNDIANLCERVGANVDDVRKGMGADSRIGDKFLYAGCGYGGSCFPKDVRALIQTGRENGHEMEILKAVTEVNERQKHILFKKLTEALGDVKGKTIAVLGLAFKPDTDDMREAPSLVLIDEMLKNEVGLIKAYDPIVKSISVKDERIVIAESMHDAICGADAMVLVTEWKAFRMPNWENVKELMHGNVIIDGRNIYNRKEIEEFGFIYKRIG